MAKKLNPINNAIKKIEKQLSQLDESLAEIEEKLAGGSLYELKNKTVLKNLLLEQSNLNAEKDQQEEKWLLFHDELESLQSA